MNASWKKNATNSLLSDDLTLNLIHRTMSSFYYENTNVKSKAKWRDIVPLNTTTRMSFISVTSKFFTLSLVELPSHNLKNVEIVLQKIKFYSLATLFIYSYGQSPGMSHAEELKNKQTNDSDDGKRFVYFYFILIVSVPVYSGNHWRLSELTSQSNLHSGSRGGVCYNTECLSVTLTGAMYGECLSPRLLKNS